MASPRTHKSGFSNKLFASAACAALALCLGAPAMSAPMPAPAAPAALTLQMHVKIPMRDGTKLNATLYRAEGETKPRPTIFMFTPYPDDTSHPSASYFARRGFNYAYVDVRGRGDSEGEFTPFEHDAVDGYDVVEWIAKQPWSNGQVAMYGGSYAGGDQWQVAGMKPPHLSAVAPVASVRPGVDFPMSQNIHGTYDEQWLSLTTGHPFYGQVFTNGGVWRDTNLRLFRKGAAFSTLDVEAGNPNATFHTWVKHPEYDAYWQGLSPTKEQIGKIGLPMLVITGANDGDQQGTLSYYKDLLDVSGGKLPPNYLLVMGPWDHPGTREPKADFGGEHYGPASVLDLMRLHTEWYRYAMQGGAKPAFFEKNVAYYVSGAGAECWKFADSLGEATKKTQTLYFNAEGGANGLYRAGVMQPQAAGAVGGAWVSDPKDLSRADASEVPPGDDLHGDGLVFHTAPFTEDTEIDGRIGLDLSLAIDGPDADIAYGLYLITPDGKAHGLDFNALRARYRQSLQHAEPVTPGAIEHYRFGDGQWFAVRAPKGSRLRLVLRSMNEPDAEKNWNSPRAVADQTSADAHREEIRLVQSAEHQSTLTLPLGDASATCKASASW
jgi:putative CocE/NonD family hydrolase